MGQAEIDDKIQEAEKYNAEKYLVEAVKSLRRNMKIDIKITECKWFVVANKLALKIIYSANGHNVILRVVESIFKDYQRQVDAKIGIKPEMKMGSKIILRLAYLLYTHIYD